MAHLLHRPRANPNPVQVMPKLPTPGPALPLAAGAAGAAALLGGAWWLDARRREHRRRQLHRSLVSVLLNALSAGDPFTERHSRRVADLTDALADACGLPRAGRARLRLASLLHDMGKIDDQFFEILHSGEALSAEEQKRIRRHPSESAYILEPLESVHPGIGRIVESHHENWNGGGYPRGLAGEEIPLEARIISVADVFDALAQPRRYKEPLPLPEVLSRIRAGAGSRFDPGIVQLLDEPRLRERWDRIARRGRAAEARVRERTRASRDAG